MKNHDSDHVPVLLNEVLEIFNPNKGKKYIDATVGLGGHAIRIIGKDASLLGIDWDPETLKIAKERFTENCPNASWKLVNGNFSEINKIAREEKFFPVDGILFDLGISRWHYKKAKRGFSFEDESLDMRINPNLTESALKVINYYSQEQLNEIFTKIGQEKLAGQIARAVVRTRRLKKIDSASQLSEIVDQVYQKSNLKTKKHPATKVFLALRTFVNQELENLKQGLQKSYPLLKQNGQLLIITFNSNEDRIVKNLFKKIVKNQGGKVSKIIFPSYQEVRKNPLARSAKLRVLEKL